MEPDGTKRTQQAEGTKALKVTNRNRKKPKNKQKPEKNRREPEETKKN